MSMPESFLLGAVIAGLFFAIVAAVRLLREIRVLTSRLRGMKRIDVDASRIGAAVEHLQADLVAMSALIARGRRAAETIDAEIRATTRAFSRE